MARTAKAKPKGKDALSTYRKKRDFQRTPEPGPEKEARASDGSRFVVHKHDANRLHYDLRLEMEGALASWAIPKGPSYDPAVKRLAVETEDHPLAYGDFEGRIPEGAYGAGDSLLWDRGSYATSPPGQATAMRKKGHLHVVLKGEKLLGGWHLVRTRPQGGKAQWLCIKAKDGTERPGYDVEEERPESVASGRKLTRGPERKATLRGPHPSPEVLLQKVWPPMLAVLSKDKRAAPATTYLYEVKYDGYRALAALSGGKVAVKSRNDLDFATRFPFLPEALRTLQVGELVLDGEILALDSKGTSHFQLLGDAKATYRYAAFDILWLDGEDLRQRPLEERRELLESVLGNAKPPLEVAERVEGSEEEALAYAKKKHWEGLLAKRKGSVYSGKRSSDWLKLKLLGTEELTIVGWTPQSKGAPEIGALLVAQADKKGFRYAGKVGTGFSDKVRTELLKRLRADEVPAPSVVDPPKMKGVHWVRPRLVAQLAFTEWTRDGRLRHPSFQGLREDKAPAETGQDSVADTPEKPARGKKPVGAAGKEDANTSEAVAITHPERVLFPKSHLTKADVRAYYDVVAPYLVAALDNRPLSFQQWPRGIDEPGFFRHDGKGAPPWVTRATVQHEERRLEQIVVDKPPTVAWLANQSALTLHMTSSRLASLDSPDWVVFDFDPAAEDWKALVPLAQALRALLDELKLLSLPKTSGKRGLHVFIPLAAGHTFEAVYGFAVAVGEVISRKFPELATRERALKNRHGRLYLDCEQNGRLKTMVAPYSLRAVEGAPASTPLHWDEVTTALSPGDFNAKTLEARLARVGDLFAPALKTPQRLPQLKVPPKG